MKFSKRDHFKTVYFTSETDCGFTKR